MIVSFEDVVPGEKSALGSHVFTRDEIVDFARQWDPQRFHVDEEAAKGSIFGSLVASGWHTGCVAMRLIVDSRQRFEQERRARGEPTPRLGVSPGMSNLKWPVPTRPGDEVSYFSEVLDKRETKQPQWGLVHLRTTGINQRGETAISFESWVFVARRTAGAEKSEAASP
jgi:acyl dehydratase